MAKRMMQWVMVAVMVTAGAGAAWSAGAKDVGIIDMQRVGIEYTRYKQATTQLEQRKLQLQSVVDEEEQSVLSLIEELESVRASASDSEIMRIRSEIDKRDRDLREFVGRSNMSFRDELDTLQLRTREEVEGVVREISKTHGLLLVLEKNMTLFAADALDITDTIVVELNRRYAPLPTAAREPRRGAPAVKPAASPTAFPAAETPDKKKWPFK